MLLLGLLKFKSYFREQPSFFNFISPRKKVKSCESTASYVFSFAANVAGEFKRLLL